MRIPLDILFKKQLFAIETSIRKMLYPVAENQYPTIAGNHKVEQNMTMPENKKVAGKNVPYKQKITIYYRFIGNFQENIDNRQDIAS